MGQNTREQLVETDTISGLIGTNETNAIYTTELSPAKWLVAG
jgi:hypothetical protein